MPTLIGTNTVSSISRRFIMPEIQDVIYGTNALFFRLNQANKKQIAGGMHVEQPFMYAKFSNGGPYQGYDLLDTAPNDTVINGGWDIKQYYVPVTVDGRTLARCNTPEAVVNLLTLLWEQARMQLADYLGTGLYSDIVTDSKAIDGLKGAVDDGTVSTNYAGLSRTTYTWLKAQRDASTSTLTLASLRSMVGNCTRGGHAPTIILSRKEQYNRLWSLLTPSQRFVSGPSGTDEQLAQAGFTNILFDNIPWVIDEKVFDGPNTSNSAILFLNEEILKLAIFADTDFDMEDFRKPTNQDAMVGFLKWYGNLLVQNPQLNGIMTNVSA